MFQSVEEVLTTVPKKKSCTNIDIENCYNCHQWDECFEKDYYRKPHPAKLICALIGILVWAFIFWILF